MKRDVVELLRQHDIQPSAQRVAVASYALTTTDHPSADEVWERVRRTFPMVSRATVYNTLNLFCERGLLRTVEVDPTRQYYDPTIEPHHHFYNMDTGELTDIPVGAVTLNVNTALPPGTTHAGVDVVIRVRSNRRG